MRELILKYGCNPNQDKARVKADSGELPFRVLNGNPGYINLLDALNGWQLVTELRKALDMPAAASFKHVSPAGAAVGLPLSDTLRRICFVGNKELSPLACAYTRARGADRMSSFGDFICLSDVCDAQTAGLIMPEVSDGVIAPGYEPDALASLMTKKNGRYTIIRIDAAYTPPELEYRNVFGVTFEQAHNQCDINESLFANRVTFNKTIPAASLRDLTVAMIVLKYTQSNSVCFAKDGQAIGIGAGQQSRIHCTRLAADKADLWWLRQHEKVMNLPFLNTLKRPERDNIVDRYLSNEAEDVLAGGAWQKWFTSMPDLITAAEKAAWMRCLSGVSLASDAFFPFADNIDRASRSGVLYVAEPGGSIGDEAIISACDHYKMCMCFTGLRLFHH